jgi:ABC-type phosphate transport system substrate-binding protein
MMHANRSTLVKLCLLTALAVPVQRAASAAVANPQTTGSSPAASAQLVAQANGAAPEFTLPASLEGIEGVDRLVIDGSSSMRAMNEALRDRLVSSYKTVTVDSATNGTDSALQRLSDGEIDLAAIGRPLTQEEKAAGLVEVPIAREKIAIFVGPNNPFKGDVSFEQFGQIFRGEITNWSEVGDGSGSGTIRFIDRPESSDTRQAFRAYPVFKSAPFQAGANAEPVDADETEAVINALGDDGIGYGIANQVMGNASAKIVPMHQTLPDDPRYPFSQPRSYVYKGEPNAAVQGFLAVATSPEGEEVIAEVQETEGAAAAQLEGPAATATSADGKLSARTDENNVAVIEDASGNLVAGPLAGAGGAVTAMAFSPNGEILATGTNTGKVRYWGIDGKPKGDIFETGYGKPITELTFKDNNRLFAAVDGRSGLWDVKDGLYGSAAAAPAAAGTAGTTATTAAATGGKLPWWLWLIPLLGILGGGAWWLLGRRRPSTIPEPKRQTAPTATVPPPPSDPIGDREVSNRAQSVVSTDRVVDESREISPTLTNPDILASSLDDGVIEASFESTDLESPDLEGTNLDLLTTTAAGGVILGGMAIAAAGDTDGPDNIDSANLELDAEEAGDEWDDNLNLTLDDAPSEALPPDALALDLSAPQTSAPQADQTPEWPEPVITPPIVPTPPPVPPVPPAPANFAAQLPENDDDFWEDEPSAPASSSFNDLDLSDIEAIEPTRDTVIAETDTVLDIEPDENTIIGDRAVIFGGAAATAPVDEAAERNPSTADESGIDTASFTDVEPDNLDDAAAGDDELDDIALGFAAAGIATGGAVASVVYNADDYNADAYNVDDYNAERSSLTVEELASVDDGLPDLPDGYGESRIVLLPRDPKWAYAYWDISNEHKEELRRQGGQRLMLRLYDVTDIDQNHQAPHSLQQQDCHEMARSWYIEIPVSDRDYTAELGYLTADDHWLMLARSAPVRVPPIYPSDWVKDQFVTIGWEEGLAGRSFGNLGQPVTPMAEGDHPVTDLPPIYSDLFALTQSQEAMRVAGSLFGSMQQAMPIAGAGALSPSGSGINMSGLNVSGLNMSGVGLGRSRNFWLVADAELIVYGATEPDATVTIAGQVIPLNPDGTFRFHMPFPDGQIDYPIRAVAVDGEQSRSIQMTFERETPERNTNTKDEAQDEWF